MDPTALALVAALAAATPDYHASLQVTMTEQDHRISSPAGAHYALAGLALGELALDGLQTQAALRGGRCHEADPVAAPFVHSMPVSLAAEAVVAYAITRLPNKPWANALLGLFVGGEAANIANIAHAHC